MTLMDALNHCHRNGVVHRNLNPSNIMLASMDDAAAIKIVGFGSACSVLDGYVTTKCLNPDFAPPEILLEKPHGKVGGRSDGRRLPWCCLLYTSPSPRD